MPSSRKAALEVTVFDVTHQPMSDAKVSIRALGRRGTRYRSVPFDKRVGAHLIGGLAPGPYLLRAEARGCAPQERRVALGSAAAREIFVLGAADLPVLMRGTVAWPFKPPEGLVAAVIEPSRAREAGEHLERLIRDLGLSPAKAPEAAQAEGVHVYKLPAAAIRDRRREAELLARLDAAPFIAHAGRVVRIDEQALSLLTPELVVKFKGEVGLDDVPKRLEQMGLRILRRIVYAGNAFLVRAPHAATFDVLDIAIKLATDPAVEYAEPHLYSTAVEDAVHPNDWLYPAQWHFAPIECPDAWQLMRDVFGTSRTFGAPEIVIAVMDSGCDTGNPDLAGTLSDGSDKVHALFDFLNMAASNDGLTSAHGTQCAGIATGAVGNASPVAGIQDGVVGAAGNCKLMGLRRGGPEIRYSDAYIWAAGFDPESTTAGFPAKLAKGSEIITSSFGVSVGMPISGLMKDCIDHLTTYGRGGRGVLMFFSIGNGSPVGTPVDFTLQRPWAAYERTFAIAASTFANDGVSEVKASYSNFAGVGVIDLCAPSSNGAGAVHNPPQIYRTITTGLVGQSPYPQHPLGSTTLQAAVAANATVLNVVNTAGFSVGDRLLVDSPDSGNFEAAIVSAVGAGTLTVGPLLRAHAAGALVARGPGNVHNFGGTSSSTPLVAGIAALVLSAKPQLTWTEVREILRETADPIDVANTDPIGIWTDVNGLPSTDPAYAGPFYSRWYGFGRVNARAAVERAIMYAFPRDVVVRDNLADVGAVPSTGKFWASPDLWVRNQHPAADGIAALPAGYLANPPHQSPVASQDNWVYVRLRNFRAGATLDFYVRVYLTHWAGTEFRYPDDFVPTTRPSDPIPTPLVPGTYLIGEFHHDGLAGDAQDIVNLLWPEALIPPATVTVGGTTVTWHPCVLVEVSPQDGPTPTGPFVWDNNNLAQRNLSIVYADAPEDNDTLFVVGNVANLEEYFELCIEPGAVPAEIDVYLEILDPRARRALRQLVEQGKLEAGVLGPLAPLRELALTAGSVSLGTAMPACHRKPVVTWDKESSGWSLGSWRGREVVWLKGRRRICLPILAGPRTLVPVVVGAVTSAKHAAAAFELGITQRSPMGEPMGAAAVEIRVGGYRPK